MTPPECKTCGKRTDLQDMNGNYRCFQCRRELWPHVYVSRDLEPAKSAPVGPKRTP